MAGRGSEKSSLSSLFATVLLSFLFIIILIAVMEMLGSKGYIEKGIIKVVKEIPFGNFLGKGADKAAKALFTAIMKRTIDAGKDIVYYGSETKMTLSYFFTNLLKLVLSGLIFKGVDTMVENLSGIKEKMDPISIIRKGFIKFWVALLSAWVAALAYSTLKTALELGKLGVFSKLSALKQSQVAVVSLFALLLIILIIFAVMALTVGAFTLQTFLGFVILKTLVVNSLSILVTFFVSLVVLYGIQYGFLVQMIWGFLPIIFLAIIILALLDRFTEGLLGK